MPSAVVDASVVVEVLTGGPSAAALFSRLFQPRLELHAPHSLDLEVANAVKKLWRRGHLSDENVDEIGGIYRDLRIVRYATAPFLDRIWRLRYNFSPYDAAYIALAEWLDVPLITRDTAFEQAATHHTARVELFA